jgi:hypothetical protein
MEEEVFLKSLFMLSGDVLIHPGQGAFAWASHSRKFRESMSEGPLGLRGKRKRPHAVMCVDQHTSIQQVGITHLCTETLYH